MLFGSVSVFLAIGKYDYYINELLYQVNLVYFNNELCSFVQIMNGWGDYFHNLMPLVVGELIIYVVHFIAKA